MKIEYCLRNNIKVSLHKMKEIHTPYNNQTADTILKMSQYRTNLKSYNHHLVIRKEKVNNRFRTVCPIKCINESREHVRKEVEYQISLFTL
jgi:hypothetical protein